MHRAQQTLHVTGSRSVLGFLAWTVLILIIHFLAGEALVRTNVLQSLLGPRGVGSEHRTFEEQWSRLEKYAEERGSLDCVFLGDSTVMSDFAPFPFAESYREESGEELACFNFGVGALSVVGTATLARLLVHEYAPQLILVGLEPLNFTVPRDEQGAADLESVPWVNYRLGTFTLEGWAYERSYLLGYLRTLRNVLLLSIQESGIRLVEGGETVGAADGFYPVQGTGPFDVSRPPDPTFDHPYLEHYFAAHKNFEMLPENLAALEQILAMNSSPQIILVEMPLAPTFSAFFGHGEEDYMEFVTTVGDRASAYSVTFYHVPESGLLSSSLWYNYNHLNADGAPIFSRWLGQRLGSAAQASQRRSTGG